MLNNFSRKEQIEYIQPRIFKRYLISQKDINDLSQKAQIEAIRQDPFSIRFIKKPSIKIQLAAVKKDGAAILFIENPLYEVQIEAVKENGLYIKFIENPTEEIQLLAIKSKTVSINNVYDLIKNPTQRVLDELVIKDIIE